MGYALLTEKALLGQKIARPRLSARERAASRWGLKEKVDVSTTSASGSRHYYRARYYDPQVGRFLTEDPRGFREGVNFYAYVFNNPINNVDPTGLGALKPIIEVADLLKRKIDDFSPASTPTGSKGDNLFIPDPKNPINTPTNIGGRDFSGHALDNMQSQGITPSAVENAINPANAMKGKAMGTTAYYDSVNDITVIKNDAGKIVTVDRGFIKQGASSSGVGSTLLDAGSAILGGAIGILEVIDMATDPVGNFIMGSDVGAGSDCSSGCGSTFNDFQSSNYVSPINFGSGASGGFVLYPSKPNLNMMNQVYSK